MSRVAFLLGNLTDGGSETKTVKMANRFAESGHDIHVIYLGLPDTLRSLIDDRVSVLFLDRRGKYSAGALRRLRAYLAANAIDTLVCVNHYPLVYGWPACKLGGPKRRCIAAMNTYEFTSLRDRFFMLIYAYILRRCDRVLFGSEAQERLWLDKYGLDPERCEVIYNGVDAEHFAEGVEPGQGVRQSLGIDNDAIVIGCVAHLRPEKSHADLISAVDKLTGISTNKLALLLVGEGPEEGRLRSLVDAAGLGEQVFFCGRAADVRPYLDAMDIFVMPSSSEVFSNAILEAMSMQLPVVCTAVGGSVEMVEHGVTGMTYPRHQVTELVTALQTLLSDGEMRRRFGETGAQRVRDVFSIRAMDERYAAVIARSSSGTGRD